jgi:hypothetical protein
MKETMMKANLMIAAAAMALLAACSQPQQAEAPAAPAAAAEDHASHDHSGPVTITATPAGTYQVGQPVTMTLRLTDQNGQPIVAEDLAVKHEHRLHVMVVDTGLEDYTHAHPTANADGTFTLSFTPRLDRPYRLWADFALNDHHEEAPAEADHGHDNGHDHGHDHAEGGHGHGDDHHESGMTYASVDLPVGAGAAPSIAATQTLSAEADGLRFQLSLESALRAGQATRVRLAVVDASGRPYTQLEPLMGAFAHVVGFNPGATKMMHVQPDGAEPTSADARGGPTLAFTLEPEAAGPQRLFVQVKANGREVMVPFTLVVG